MSIQTRLNNLEKKIKLFDDRFIMVEKDMKTMSKLLTEFNKTFKEMQVKLNE